MNSPHSGLIRPYESELNFVKHAVDGILIFIILLAACWIYLGSWGQKYTNAAIFGVSLFYIAAKINNLYLSSRYKRVSQEITPLLYTWCATVAGLLFLGYMFKITQEYSRMVLGLWFIGAPMAMALWRALLKSGLSYARRLGYNSRSVVIVGTGRAAQHLADNIKHLNWIGLRFLGYITPDHGDECPHKASIRLDTLLGDLATLRDLKDRHAVDVVYIALPASRSGQIDTILEMLSDSTVSTFLVPDFDLYGITQGRWITIGDVPTVSVVETPLLGSSAGLKRCEDLLVSLLLISATAPLMVLIALAIKLDSRGPILYKQRRHGLNGQEISVWKFRSMTASGDDQIFKQAQKDDSRVTRVGRFLRRSSLDELPQLFNVLRGDMSIVGPRPHALAHNEEYRGSIWGYMQRHKVKPGITGLAQVRGFRGETDIQEKMEQRFHSDMEYLNNWSVWLDLKIILLTPFALISGKNAH